MDDTVSAENLKALRLLHQILMVVAAAVLAFALRPDLSSEYSAALEELSSLKEVSFNTWPNFINERYKAREDENNKFILSIIGLAGLGIQGHPKLSGPILGEAPPNLGGAKLIDFDAFLSGNRKIGALRLEGNKRYMVEQLRKAAAARNPHPSVGSLSLSGFASSGYYGLTDWINVAPAGPVNVFFAIYDQPQTVPNSPVFVIASYTISSETGHFALDWVRGDAFGQKLVDSKTGVVFPRLKVFWDRVSSLTDDQATVFLQEELSASGRGTLSFFGIPVERSVAIGAGPAVCLSILLFLALHLKHFRALGAQDGAVTNYPWIALFRGPLALGTTYASILILPIFASVMLLYRYGHWADLSTRVGIALLFLMLATSCWVLTEIHSLRARS